MAVSEEKRNSSESPEKGGLKARKLGLNLALFALALGIVAFLFWPSATPSSNVKKPRAIPTNPSTPVVKTEKARAGKTPTALPRSQDEYVPKKEQVAAEKILVEAPKHLEKVVAANTKQDFDIDDFKQVLPPDSKITVDSKTWTKIDDHTIMVKADVTKPGEATVSYAVILAREDAKSPWKIIGTLDYDENAKPLTGQ